MCMRMHMHMRMCMHIGACACLMNDVMRGQGAIPLETGLNTPQFSIIACFSYMYLSMGLIFVRHYVRM
jgi:hypothetical protein